MKKIISAFLCVLMLVSVVILPISAFVNLDDENVTWSDRSALKVETPLHGNHPINISFGKNITENSTVTLYVKPDRETVSERNSFPLYLVANYYDASTSENTTYSNSVLTGISFEHYHSYGMAVDLNLGQPSFSADAKALVPDQWNRIDMLVDNESNKMTAYLNYEKIGTADFANDLSGYKALYIPYLTSTVKYCYVDDLMVRSGCVAPAKGDIACSPDEQTLLANKADVLYFDSFDASASRLITNDVKNISKEGAVTCKRQGYEQGGHTYSNEIVTTEGLVSQSNAEYRGVQLSEGEQGTYNARFVGTVDSLEHDTLGFEFSVNGGTKKQKYCEYVYDAILATRGATVTYEALGEFGASYVYCLTVTGMKLDVEYDFTVSAFVYDDGQKKTSAEYELTVVNGSVKQDSGVKEQISGTVVNIDSDAISNMVAKYGEEGFTDGLYVKSLDWFDTHYKDCGITDLIYDVSAEAERKDKYGITEGVADPYEIWFEQCGRNGINPWISVRMNDVHEATVAESEWSDFRKTAKANGWLIGNGRRAYWLSSHSSSASRYKIAYNYQIQEVREYFIAQIDTALSNHDAYGLELDWQRVIWCFPEDSIDNCQYMNIFMEDVVETVEKYEEKYGHDIKINVRVSRDIDENKYFGFDLETWAKDGWIDAVTPTSYWGLSDSDMPIAEWKQRLGEYGVEIYAGLEGHAIYFAAGLYQNTATLAGFSASYLGQGADKMYLYDLFNGVDKESYAVCSSLERALSAQKRSYLVTQSNCTPYGIDGINEYKPLPITVSTGGNKSVNISHGQLNAANDAIIFIGVSSPAAIASVKFNGVECTRIGESTASYVGTYTGLGTVIAYTVPESALGATAQNSAITISTTSQVTVSYIELMN